VPFRSFLPFVPLLVAAGCAPPPTVTKGTFTGSHTLTMQRGSADVIVRTTGTGTYTITNYSMDHPMGQRPDTEATFTTPAGKFVISDKGASDGLFVNGVKYTYSTGPHARRIAVTIDEKGAVGVDDPNAKEPKGEPAPPKG
jgi:hypothetical protein